MVTNIAFANTQRCEIGRRTMRRYVSPGVCAHARRTTNRRLAVSVAIPHATFCQLINIRCIYGLVTTAAQIVKPELVAHNEQNVLASRWLVTGHSIILISEGNIDLRKHSLVTKHRETDPGADFTTYSVHSSYKYHSKITYSVRYRFLRHYQYRARHNQQRCFSCLPE